MEKSKLPIIGGVVTAIVASLCCIGPSAVVLIGIGSIGVFSHFEAFRPYFIGLTVVILGFAFYLTYRTREVKCEDGTCKVESASKWSKIIVWLATILAVGAIAFPYVYSPPSTGENISVTPGATAILSIKGMDCKACARGIEGMLAGIEGVRQAKVDYDKALAEVTYDSVKVKRQAFVDRINETSYEASMTEIKKGQ